MQRSVARLAMFVLVLSSVVLAPRMLAAQDKPAETGNLAVSVTYTGKGTVDKDHRIWIWVFDTPDISPSSTPIQTADLAESGGTSRFVGLPKQVYLAMAYDEKGGYDGTVAAPPPGTPVAIHGAAAGGSAAPVPTGGDDAVLKTSFDDSVRMP